MAPLQELTAVEDPSFTEEALLSSPPLVANLFFNADGSSSTDVHFWLHGIEVGGLNGKTINIGPCFLSNIPPPTTKEHFIFEKNSSLIKHLYKCKYLLNKKLFFDIVAQKNKNLRLEQAYTVPNEIVTIDF